jgi:hypothetical protein
MRPCQPSHGETRGLAHACLRVVTAWLSAGLILGMLGMTSLAVGTTAAPSTKSATAPSPHAARSTGSRPLWRELTARQQKALQPLMPHWDELTESHKRKWLALSRNYARMSAADQKVLHSRMTEWASLSKQQRAQARLNFSNVKQVPADERKAKWEAYQALSDEEKRKLAARAKISKPPGSAPAQKPAHHPATSPHGQRAPRIQLAPSPATAP